MNEPSPPRPDTALVADLHRRLAASIGSVIRGQERPVRLLIASLVAGGHVLIEDRPGTGKTTLAKALARSLDTAFGRIQFTPDLLPSDILGVSVYRQREQDFQFHPGPVFTHVLLADEINRASPRTQSALLEAMAEGQASIEGVRRPLPDPFFVMATQNPVEFHGTYPLPEAQMDRFAMRLSLGYVSREDEMALISDQAGGHPLERLAAVASIEDLRRARAALAAVAVAEPLRRYMVELVAATRALPQVALGASPRATLALAGCARALAAFDGLGFVTPDQVQEVAVPVLAHRLALDPQARFSGVSAATLVEDLLRQVPPPA